MNHRSGISALAAAIASVALSTPSVAAPKVQPVNEGGDTQSCITIDEFNAVFIGMPRHRAQRVIDSRGQRITHSSELNVLADTFGFKVDRGDILRKYTACDTGDYGYKFAVIEFRHDGRQRMVSGFMA